MGFRSTILHVYGSGWEYTDYEWDSPVSNFSRMEFWSPLPVWCL